MLIFYFEIGVLNMEILTNPAITHDNKNIRAYWNIGQHAISIIVTNQDDTKRVKNKEYEPFIYKSNTNIDDDQDNLRKTFAREIRGRTGLYDIYITLDDANKIANALINFYVTDNTANKVLEQIDNEQFAQIFHDVQNEIGQEDLEDVMVEEIQNNAKSNVKTPNEIMEDYIKLNHNNDLYNINHAAIWPYDLIIDWQKVNAFDGDMANKIVKEPTDALELIESVLVNLTNDDVDLKNINIKFDNMEVTAANQLLANKVGQMVQTIGIVKGMLEPQFYYETAAFECVGCKRIHEVEQKNIGVILEPSMCHECGTRRFRLIKEKSTAKDLRYIKLQEPTEDLSTDQRPRNLLVCLPGNTSYNIVVGERIKVTGILDGDLSEDNGNNNYILIANHVVKLEDKKIEITDEDEAAILELAKKDNILDVLCNSFAPNIILDNEIKLMLLCYIVKAGYTEDLRHEIHILIIGDPGIAKTKIKDATFNLCEKGIKASGTNASGVGLTGAVSKDPILGTPIIEAGAIPMANNGHLFIDEFEKMPTEESQKVLNFMESGEDTITKWGLNETLKGETSIFAIGNPVYGKFDEYKTINEQIKIYPATQSRFDIVLALEDKVNENKDRQIATSILNRFRPNKKEDDDAKNDLIDNDLLRKYLTYARNNFNPIPIEDSNMDEYLEQYYVESRQNGKDARSFEAVNRFAGAIAKLKLHEYIQTTDYKKSIELQNYSIKSLGMDPTNVDAQDIRGNNSNKEKQHRNNIKKIMNEYMSSNTNLDVDAIPKKILKETFMERFKVGKTTFNNAFKQLKDGNEIYEHKKYVYFKK